MIFFFNIYLEINQQEKLLILIASSVRNAAAAQTKVLVGQTNQLEKKCGFPTFRLLGTIQ